MDEFWGFKLSNLWWLLKYATGKKAIKKQAKCPATWTLTVKVNFQSFICLISFICGRLTVLPLSGDNNNDNKKKWILSFIKCKAKYFISQSINHLEKSINHKEKKKQDWQKSTLYMVNTLILLLWCLLKMTNCDICKLSKTNKTCLSKNFFQKSF